MGRDQSGRESMEGRSQRQRSRRRSSSASTVQSLSYADGAVWAALGEEGKVVRIDATTDETVSTTSATP